jgi:uncharacterized repeat protein (TIGR03803 family)
MDDHPHTTEDHSISRFNERNRDFSPTSHIASRMIVSGVHKEAFCFEHGIVVCDALVLFPVLAMRKDRTTIPWKIACAALLLCVAAAIPSPAQTYTTLFSFDVTDGSQPYSSLVQGLDGNLYGTTLYGGPQSHDNGTVYKITPSGVLATLEVFSCIGNSNCPNGEFPYAGLALATDGSLYGTAMAGGAHNRGAVFKISSSGTFTLVHSFVYGRQECCPYGGLVQVANGDLYGTNAGEALGGTIFKITPRSNYSWVYCFCSGTDGAAPYAAMVQGTDANLYGTTVNGGANGDGTVFKMTPSGTLTALYRFCSQTNCTDGANPYAGLVQGSDGNFYGTTANLGGGTHSGTVFKITPGGALTTLHAFCSQTNCTDGANPYADLIQAIDGNFYGTTLGGGTYNRGTVFKITPSGTLTTLHSFCSQTNCTDGANPYAGLVQATDGSFYGATSSYGAGVGTVFRFSVGLGPFVESLPTSGNVGAAIKILGTKLTGTTAVSFNGIAATFTVVSGTEIMTTVPSGATTGFVTVTTPSGKLKSNKKFRVTP